MNGDVWYVCDEGYNFRKTAKNSLLAPSGSTYRPLQLLEHPTLFLHFASLPLEEGAYQDFANSYGLLTTAPVSSDPSAASGETLELWDASVWSMQQAVNLWDLCRHRDLAALAERIEWRADKSVWFIPDPMGLSEDELHLMALAHRAVGHTICIASSDRDPEWLAQFPAGSVLEPALRQLGRWAEEQLGGRLTAACQVDARSGRMEWRWPPTNLLQALWQQFAQALAHNLEIQRCHQCNRWFEKSPRKSRLPRMFCSNACKLRSYRERQDRARRMHYEDKKPLKQIARELGVDLSKVKWWVTGRKT